MEFQYESNRIFIEQDGELLAEISFPALDETTVNIDHTFVKDTLQGQGVASKLVEALVTLLHKEDKKCIVTCSYAQSWFEKHPEEKERLR